MGCPCALSSWDRRPADDRRSSPPPPSNLELSASPSIQLRLPRKSGQMSFLEIQRFAFLGRFGVIWTGAHTNRPWPRGVHTSLIQAITCEPEQDVSMPGWSDCRLELPAASIDEKRAFWQQVCPRFDQWPEEDRAALTQSLPVVRRTNLLDRPHRAGKRRASHRVRARNHAPAYRQPRPVSVLPVYGGTT